MVKRVVGLPEREGGRAGREVCSGERERERERAFSAEVGKDGLGTEGGAWPDCLGGWV